MNTLKVKIAQLDLAWEDIPNNLNQVRQELFADQDIDLLILPEMFLTGFSMNVQTYALEDSSAELTELKALSSRFSTGLLGSVMFKTPEGTFVNRMLLIDGQRLQYYDKIHLFSPGKESDFYARGKEVKIFEFRSWKIKPQICYDLRFPVESFNYEEYDLLVYVANWPIPRIKAWTELLKSRAIENQAYVIGCNRVGEDGNHWKFNGQSVLINAMGESLLNLGHQKQSMLAQIDKEHLSQTRTTLPFLKDKTRLI